MSLKPFVKGTDMVHGHSFHHGKTAAAQAHLVRYLGGGGGDLITLY